MSLLSTSRRWSTGLFAALAVIALGTADVASAKVGGGASIGSRGGRSFSAPPPTNTAPRTAAPIQRPSQQANAATTAPRPSMFGGFRGLIMGGLFAAALAGIFGTGFLANAFGFLLQIALFAFLASLAYRWFTGRRFQMPSMATARSSYAGYGAAQPASGYGTPDVGASTSLAINGPDFDAFERLLGEIQTAYGRGDVQALSARATPEMLSHFQRDLAQNAEKGLRNEIREPKLLQGDLSEAWHESSGEYATVAMRFALIDTMVDRNGQVVSGNAAIPTESTELWTFRRPIGGRPDQWTLSAIQQAN